MDFEGLIKISPEGLALHSSFNSAMSPRIQAPQRVNEALAEFDTSKTAETEQLVAQSVKDRERTYGGDAPTKMSDDVFQSLKEVARKLNLNRRRQSPPIESIILDSGGKSHIEYDLVGTTGGIKGCLVNHSQKKLKRLLKHCLQS